MSLKKMFQENYTSTVPSILISDLQICKIPSLESGLGIKYNGKVWSWGAALDSKKKQKLYGKYRKKGDNM